MGSQTDLDQGGTSREWVNTYLGPSVGWVRLPSRNLLEIIAAGTYNIDYSTNLIHINTTGAVVLNLPSAQNTSVPAGVLPGKNGKIAISIVDISGAPNVTIDPAAGETIVNAASLTLTNAYSGFILYPSNTLKGWTNQS